jgi:sulfur carrier protein ThiS
MSPPFSLLTEQCICCRIVRAMEIEFRNKKWDLKAGITARDAIRKIGIDPEAVLVVVNGKLTTDDVILKENDKVKLVAVVSGGAHV